jgi:hypothetical protein
MAGAEEELPLMASPSTTAASTMHRLLLTRASSETRRIMRSARCAALSLVLLAFT